MITERPIVFLDSGIGGLPYLEQIRKSLPNEGYLYLADNAAFPYGEKSQGAVREIVVRRVGQIIEAWEPKLIVIACNTASVVALGSLRSEYDLPFVGVVPAVKPAALRTAKGRIALLATTGTVVDGYTDDLIEKYAGSSTVSKIPAPDLANFIEHEIHRANPAERAAAVEKTVVQVRESGIDTLVLGCTHFIYVKDDLRKAFRDKVEIVDSRDGVRRQVVTVVDEIGCAEQSNGNWLFVTGDHDSRRLRELAARFELAYGGALTG